MNVSKTIMQNFNRIALIFAVCLITLTPALALTNETHKLSLNNSAKNSFKPSAVFKDVWIDYDVTEGGEDGMRIHVSCEVTGLRNISSKIVARVTGEDGEYLTTDKSSYSNDGGELEASFDMKPGFATTVFKDADMFLPYSAINLDAGVYNLKLDIDLNYANGTLIQHLTWKEFKFTRDNADETPTKGDVSATVKKIWVDYDVTEGGRKGMRVHVNFEVNGLKGVDSKITARIRKENDDYLTSRSASFSNGEGQFETSFDMKPGYPTAVFEDAAMFVPYNEINIRKGVWTLKLDVDLNYENGDLIQHLDYHEFEFTQP
jgi:hypothetical protein